MNDRLRPGLFAVVAVLLILSASTAVATRADSLLFAMAALMRENPSQGRLDAALISLTDRAVKDWAGPYRYETTLDGLPCGVYTGYGIMTNSLDFILIDSRIEGGWIEEMQWKRNGVRQALTSMYGKPHSEIDGGRAFKVFQTDAKLTSWAGDFGSCVLTVEGIECGGPQVSVLFLSRAASDSLRRADKELDIDSRDRPRAWVEWARSRYFPRLVLPESLRTPAAADADLGSTRNSIVVEELPEIVHHEFPKFPQRAVDLWVSGTVWISALLGTDGKVIEARILKRSGRCVGFEEAALETVYKTEYTPAKRNGKPVPVWVSYRLDFDLRR